MKKITQAQEKEIIAEVFSIVTEIYGYKPKSLTVVLKQGGWTATACPTLSRLEIRIDVWLNSPLISKRLVLCHECLHLKGWMHSAKNNYTYSTDIASIALYETIWGSEDINKLKEEMKSMLPFKDK